MDLQGATWPRTLIFFVLDATTKKICIPDPKASRILSSVTKMLASQSANPYANAHATANHTSQIRFPSDNTCSTKLLTMVRVLFLKLVSFSTKDSTKRLSRFLLKECIKGGGKCFTTFDSFYIIALGSALIGLVWYAFAYKVSNKLQTLPKSEWIVTKRAEQAS